MSSEENLIKHYEHSILFKALVFNKIDLGVYVLITVAAATWLWVFAIFAIYIQEVVVFCFGFWGGELYCPTYVASGPNGKACLSKALCFTMAVGLGRF